MSRAEKLANFDPNAPASGKAQVFGLPFNFDESALVILPVPWEVTASYGSGTSRGPEAIRAASLQVDLFSEYFPNAWQAGFFMLESSKDWLSLSDKLRPGVIEYQRLLEGGSPVSASEELIERVNAASEELRKWVFRQISEILAAGKIPVVLGGEHSVPLGAMQAVGAAHEQIGLLQIDAHADLRVAYMGLKQSHASICQNALNISNLSCLTQVGLRDICDEEAALIDSDERVHAFTDKQYRDRIFKGESWSDTVDEIISTLPEKVYLTVDIDGLDPSLCPNTGTPVPGGLSFSELAFLISSLVEADKKIVGLDLCEVATRQGNDWDANVGARVLYLLCNAAVASNGLVVRQ